MQATPDQTDLKPPRSGRWSAPLVLAVLAHLMLLAALTWGVSWQKDTPPAAFEAELWSSVAQQAAPREVTPPPPPPPKVEPKPTPPKPEPKPEPKVEPKAPDTREADIAIAQAKRKKEEAEKREAEKKAAAKKKAEDEAREKAKKLALAKQKAEDQKRLDEKIAKLEEEKERKLKAQREEAAAQARYAENVKRMLGQAGATGAETAKGTAQRSSGPSSGYAGRVNAAVRPNVLLTEDIPGNPKAEIDVQSAPDGTILSRRLSRSSGNAAWDKAALDAIDRTGKMPRDVDGRVPSPLTIVMRPRD